MKKRQGNRIHHKSTKSHTNHTFLLGISFSLLLIGAFLFIYLPRDTFTGNVIVTPSTPTDCSDASIKSLWDSIFKETSSGITIIANTSETGKCTTYFAYKIIDSSTYSINSISGNPAGTIRSLNAIYTDGNQNFINYLKNLTSSNYMASIMLDVTQLSNRSLDISSGDTEFKSKFKTDTTTWLVTTSPLDQKEARFTENETSASLSKTVRGYVNLNRTYDSLTYTENSVAPAVCNSTWVQINGSCQSDETKFVWYNDTKACPSPTNRPSNVTMDCDFDGNGIIGNLASISMSHISTDVYVNSTFLNLSFIYVGVLNVELREGNQTRVSFAYNFSNPLDLKGVKIEKQDSSTKGYIIINGINATKSAYLDRIINASSVCVKDSAISSFSDFSSNCNATDETRIINCPNSTGVYGCALQGNNTLVISGLTHSAVEEFSPPSPSCTQNWNCTAWSTCLGGIHNRTCSDINSCNSTSARPSLSGLCTVTAATNTCTSSWNCAAYTNCTINNTQTRTCTDVNHCQTSSPPKPETSKSCTYVAPTDNTLVIIIVSVVGVIIIAVIIFVVMILLQRNPAPDSFSTPPSGPTYGAPPIIPSMPPTSPAVSYPPAPNFGQ